MKNLKKYLLAILLLVVALTLVACGAEEKDDNTPKETKISAIKIQPTIYDGEEDKPYVLVGEEIYFEAELTAENEALPLNEVEKWSIDKPEIAELKVNEEGGIICVGKKGGNATVTATNQDGTITASFEFEVAVSKSATDVLVAANDEIIANFPKYVAADTQLPVPANPNVTIKYKNNITGGITVNNGVYKYAYDGNKGDVNKGINFTLTYHGEKLESVTYFYEVKDINDNLFLSADKVAEKITEILNTYEKAVDKDGNATTLPLLTENKQLPTSFTKAEVGRDVTLSWATDKDTDTVKSIDANGVYTYAKAKCDTAVLFYATISIYEKYHAAVAGTTEVIKTGSQYYVENGGVYTLVTKTTPEYFEEKVVDVKVGETTVQTTKYVAKEGVTYYTYGPVAKATNTVVVAGATPDEVIAYFQSCKYCPTDGTTSSNSANLKTSDTSGQYPGLSVDWSFDADDKGVYTKQGRIIYSAEGEHKIYGTFYYNKKLLESYFKTEDITVNADKTYYTYDETNKVYTAVKKGAAKAELLNTYYECSLTESYTWKKSITITVTYTK